MGIGVDDEAPTCAGATRRPRTRTRRRAATSPAPTRTATPLFYDIVDQPAHGTAAINANTGHWTYTPAADFNGSDSFTAAATDGALSSNAATISLTIDPVNDAPDCTPATSSGDEETPQSGTVSCIDVEGDAVTYVMGTAPAKGTMTTFDTSTGDWTYTPLVNRNGTDRSRSGRPTGRSTRRPRPCRYVVDVERPPVAKNDTKSFT